MEEESLEIGGLNSEKYGQKYQDHLIEQYKLYVEMADRMSNKRTQTNSFFLGLCTALIAGGAAVYGKGYTGPTVVILIALLAILVLCYTWWRLIISYRQLNSAKYRIIVLLERHLPAAPYSREWNILGEGKSPELYRPLSGLECWVPLMFAILFVLLAVCLALFPL